MVYNKLRGVLEQINTTNRIISYIFYVYYVYIYPPK